MDFELTEHQRLIQEGIRETVRDFGLEYWREKDRAHAFPTELWQTLGRGGWLGVAMPEEFGGAGQGILELALVVEEACRAGGGSTLSQLFMTTPVFGGETVKRHGSEEQRRRYLPKIASGEIDFCMALTEPNAGSDTLAIETRAVREGDMYRINGQKVFITAIDRAQRVLVIVRTTPASEAPSRSFGISLFLADTKAEGLSYQSLEKVGTHCIDSFTVFFDDVRVPADELVGDEGKGWTCILDTLNAERVVTAAGCIGTADIALKLACDYAAERVVFGRPIGANQGIQFPLAEIKVEVEMARLMNQKAAWLYDRGENAGAEANMAKYLAAEVAFRACDRAMQTLGGYGYAAEYHLERLWRDVRLFRLAPVTQEMILNYIGRHVLGMPRSY
ncbi:MAG: acyl-CoA dehydrogenase family protein [Dehalococcoidia bacterium]